MSVVPTTENLLEQLGLSAQELLSRAEAKMDETGRSIAHCLGDIYFEETGVHMGYAESADHLHNLALMASLAIAC